MVELWIEVERVEGTCTGPIPMAPGTGFLVRNGSLVFPGGGPICLFALASILSLIPAKERLKDGDPAADWMGEVHHVQCPDPDGRTIWRIEQATLGSTSIDPSVRGEILAGPAPGASRSVSGSALEEQAGDLRIVVDRIEGRCNEGMRVGHSALVRESSLYLAQPFCLYAMQAALPLLTGKVRAHDPADWMTGESTVVCPDPLGNVILRIEQVA